MAVYIVLGILYESYIHPITILSTLPSAGLGAVLALLLFHMDLNVIALIGVILLIGIVKKNAIMMIDFALAAERQENKTSEEAIYQACLLRFRPILMTTMAAIVRRAAVGPRHGHRLRIAQAAGHHHHRRLDRQPDAHSLHHARRLSLFGSPASSLGSHAPSRLGYCGRGASRLMKRLSLLSRATGKSVAQCNHEISMMRKTHSRSQLLTASIVLAAFAFGGCTVGPKYQRPSAPAPAAYKELTPADFSKTDGWKVAQPQDNVLHGKWWTMFNDPQLNALEEQVNISNQNIQSAMASYMAARALVKEARSQFYPTVSVGPAITGSRQGAAASLATTPGTSMFYSMPFDATWVPDLWGRVRNQVRANTASAQASAADLENARLTAQAEVAVDYYSLRGQDDLKQLLDSTVIAYQESLDPHQGSLRDGH